MKQLRIFQRLVFLLCILPTQLWLVAADAPLAAPASPTVKDVRQLRLFAEPLVSCGSLPSTADNQLLFAAIQQFNRRPEADDFSALEKFIAQHPDSAWTPALQFNLGLEYYNTGWYSKALAAWENSWSKLKAATQPEARALADRAAGELAYMYARLGRTEQLAALLDQVEGRAFIGPATEKISGARQGLWTMQHQPEIAFRCGPFALGQILLQQHSPLAECELIRNATSTTNGCSLEQVAELSRQLKMNYQAAYRSNGAALIMPAVVHWKLGHYAALLKEENGLYLLQDPTFGNDTWVSRRVLESETSGYFLVPPGNLPAGWRLASVTERSTIFGKGTTTTSDPKATGDCDKKSACPNPLSAMAVPSVHLMAVSLHVEDMPIRYRPPVGYPISLRVAYNQREANQPANFSYSNLGPKWTFNWLAYINDNPSSLSANVDYYAPGGGALPFTGFDTNTQFYAPQIKTQALLQRTSTNSYEMVFRDGAKIVFALPGSVGGTSRRVFMTQMTDPQGNTVQVNYDANFRITNIVDAIGQATTFSYENLSDTLKITKVTDPFGRMAIFTYDGSGRLATITDPVGIVSQFTYDSGDFIQALTTPYGTTTFEKGEVARTRWLVTTHPDGGKERVEYNESPTVTGAIGAEAVAPTGMGAYNGYLQYRNTFVWDQNAYAKAPNDYTKAKLYHWLHQGNNVGGIIESEKPALENRIWYAYDGQAAGYSEGTTAQPNAVGRVLDDGTTQLSKFKYNAVGQVTNFVDPLGRSVTFIYSTNQVDLLEIRQTKGTDNELLGRFLYNSQHLLTAIYDAAGQLTTNTYNVRGQLLTTKNPKGETTTLAYDASGYLTNIDGALPGSSDRMAFTYDNAGRIRTITDPDGYTITNRYDNLDRVTNVAFADGTFSAFTYDKLDRVKSRDRLGRETQFTFDALRRLTSVRDALNRVVRFEYCDCGSLAALIDALGRPTRWEYDIEGRVITKVYPNGDRVRYAYENTISRLKSITDEQGQIRAYEYNVDDSLRRISYPLAAVVTPVVNFTYDANYGRLISRQDAIGTTTYSYNPAGVFGALQVATMDGPWANDTVTYTYDALGRQTNRTINGVAAAVTFDAAGRTTGIANALGNFNYTYDAVTARVQDAVFPNGQTTHFDYFGNLNAHRLQGITHRRPDNSIISRFIYAQDAGGNITNWVQELGSVTNTWSLGQDAANQLLNVLANQGGTNFNYAYSYDLAANRLSASNATASLAFHYNSLNQLQSGPDTTQTNVTYEWNAENQLTAINAGSARTEFGYDGAGRRCRIVEKTNGVVQTERRYVWCGGELCEERDETDTVLRRFFTQGFSAGGTNYFYTRDHLRSLREVVNSTGQVQSRYAYDPFGTSTAIVETIVPSFGFTGHFRHDRSGLLLTLFRPLDTKLGRWLSRDPLREAMGPNLYAYVGNDPVNRIDLLGLCGTDPDLRKEVIEGTSGLSDAIGAAGNLYEAARYALESTRYMPANGGWSAPFTALKGAIGFEVNGGKLWLPEAPQWLSKLGLGLSLAGFAEDPSWSKGFGAAVSITGQFSGVQLAGKFGGALSKVFPAAKYLDLGMGLGNFATGAAYKLGSDAWGSDNVDIWISDLADNLSHLKFELPKMNEYKPGDFCLGQP